VHELDRVLDRDDVVVLRLVDEVDDGGRSWTSRTSGPVTSTRPLSIAASWRTGSGIPSCSRVMIFVGITRKTAPEPRCWRKRLTRKRARPGTS
jgi:hypothetical protein